ncbi:MFS general substrate transporter [Dichomitus squalens]|uniref:MFS general substrate transporter n=1 Tax=Dichomitus squalens TaxID=114155 RepID=A0A4Q9N1K3_9APHY|nr:MFS general substrate transporter [Dichomitus squalens]
MTLAGGSVEPPAAQAAQDETAPLLAKQRNKPNPLPKLQLAIIYAIKLTLPITHTQSLPYYNVFIEKLAASQGADTGYYSGLAHTVASVTQLTSMFVWGRISDKYGRVPVILLGTAGMAIFTVFFGLSGSLTSLLLNRFFGGFFFGITGAIHSVVGELSDETNQSIAFPLYDVISALGYVIGPLIGGTFAEPAKQWPDLFTNPFWTQYPYVLPCLISAAISIAASLLSVFALKETLPTKSPNTATVQASRTDEELEPLVVEPTADIIIEVEEIDFEPLGVRQLLSIPVLLAVFTSSAALGFAGSCFNSVFVLMAYSPINQGGLALSVRLRLPDRSFLLLVLIADLTPPHRLRSSLHSLLHLASQRSNSHAPTVVPRTFNTHLPSSSSSFLARSPTFPKQPSQIGRALSGMGAVSILLKLCMPALLRRYGTLNMFDFCMYSWVVAFASLPLASWVAQASAAAVDGLQQFRDASTGEWISVGFVLFLSRLGCLAFSIIMILTKDHTPGTTSLGTTNGLAELFQSLAGAAGPIVVSSLFAVSAKKHLLGRYLWVVFMVLESGFGAWVAYRIRRFRD